MTRGLASRALLLALLALSLPTAARAEVERVVVESRGDVLAGAPFGSVGPYEKISGRIHFTFDPTNEANARVVDLGRAPRTAAGRVQAWANFMALRPKQGGRRLALVEVSNRGGKAALAYFNQATFASDPIASSDFGDGLLMRQGLTVVWVGWQLDVPDEPGLLRVHVPVATDDGRPIVGLVRSDFTVDETVTTLALAHRGHVAYPVLEDRQADAVLTERDGRLTSRRVVPRDRWRFARESGGRVVEDRTHIYMPDGFRAGKIYELVYHARDPAVVGLGLAAIRDVIAYAKYDPQALFPVRAGIAFGVSQTGRFLRHFLYQGFNTDERGRRAFDGMLIHAAGAGRGSFNHRFAQASRDAHRYRTFFYPTDLFPFTSRAQRDPETGLSDGLFAHERADRLPKVVLTNTGYEYWGRAASLVHTTPDGGADVEPMPNERIYHLAGGQHFVVPFPPSPGARLGDARAWRGNPLDFLLTLRALLVRLVAWVAEGVEPPPSAFPRIADGTLVPAGLLAFPRIPRVSTPRAPHEAYRVDYGPRWSDGIIDVEPPRLGAAFPSLVPQVDAAGNELAGLRSVELLAPLATYTPWSLRIGYPAATDELVDFFGTYLPFPRNEAEKSALGDPRPSVESRYPSRAAYLDAARAAAQALTNAGTLLPEDVPRALERAERHWDWLTKR